MEMLLPREDLITDTRNDKYHVNSCYYKNTYNAPNFLLDEEIGRRSKVIQKLDFGRGGKEVCFGLS